VRRSTGAFWTIGIERRTSYTPAPPAYHGLLFPYAPLRFLTPACLAVSSRCVDSLPEPHRRVTSHTPGGFYLPVGLCYHTTLHFACHGRKSHTLPLRTRTGGSFISVTLPFPPPCPYVGGTVWTSGDAVFLWTVSTAGCHRHHHPCMTPVDCVGSGRTHCGSRFTHKTARHTCPLVATFNMDCPSPPYTTHHPTLRFYIRTTYTGSRTVMVTTSVSDFDFGRTFVGWITAQVHGHLAIWFIDFPLTCPEQHAHALRAFAYLDSVGSTTVPHTGQTAATTPELAPPLPDGRLTPTGRYLAQAFLPARSTWLEPAFNLCPGRQFYAFDNRSDSPLPTRPTEPSRWLGFIVVLFPCYTVEQVTASGCTGLPARAVHYTVPHASYTLDEPWDNLPHLSLDCRHYLVCYLPRNAVIPGPLPRTTVMRVGLHTVIYWTFAMVGPSTFTFGRLLFTHLRCWTSGLTKFPTSPHAAAVWDAHLRGL